MLLSNILKRGSIGLLILVVVFVANTSEFATASSVSGRQAELGSKGIGGYVVSEATYILDDDGNPTTLDRVILDIHPPDGASSPTEVYVKLVSNSDTWFNCTADTGNRWSCDTTNPTIQVVDMDQLSVAATG
jgi:hypothetical protein